MSADRDDTNKLTAYCGLFCLDCIPSSKRLFKTIRQLSELLSRLHIEEYAELKAERNEGFQKYPVFAQVLSELAGLECPSPCRLGGGKEGCIIRECAQGREYEGCWECDERQNCELLLPLKGFHRDTIDNNLNAIARNGANSWADKRGKHYPWS